MKLPISSSLAIIWGKGTKWMMEELEDWKVEGLKDLRVGEWMSGGVNIIEESKDWKNKMFYMIEWRFS